MLKACVLDLTGTNPDMLTNPELLHKGTGGKGKKARVITYCMSASQIPYIMYHMMFLLFSCTERYRCVKTSYTGQI